MENEIFVFFDGTPFCSLHPQATREGRVAPLNTACPAKQGKGPHLLPRGSSSFLARGVATRTLVQVGCNVGASVNGGIALKPFCFLCHGFVLFELWGAAAVRPCPVPSSQKQVSCDHSMSLLSHLSVVPQQVSARNLATGGDPPATSRRVPPVRSWFSHAPYYSLELTFACSAKKRLACYRYVYLKKKTTKQARENVPRILLDWACAGKVGGDNIYCDSAVVAGAAGGLGGMGQSPESTRSNKKTND